MDAEFQVLWKTFNQLVSIPEETTLDINKYVETVKKFKEDVNMFEEKFIVELNGPEEPRTKDINEKLKIINNKIVEGFRKTELIRKLKDSSAFSREIKHVDLDYLNKHLWLLPRETTFVDDEKLKERTIYSGYYKKNEGDIPLKCFIKVFEEYAHNETYNYEQYMYNYIETKNKILNKIENDFFIIPLDIVCVDSAVYLEMCKSHYETEIFYQHIVNRQLTGVNFKMYLTITKDVEGESLEDFLLKRPRAHYLVTSILFDIIYGVYMMNDCMNIMHNDLHFNNILIKTVPEYTKTYMIGKLTFTRKLEYKIYFYDYDLSTILEPDKKNILGKRGMQLYGLTLEKSSKDIWTVLNCIHFIKNESPYFRAHNGDFFLYMENMINVVLNNSDVHKKKYKDIFEKYVKDPKNVHWDNNCIENYYFTGRCEILHEPDLFPLPVLTRMLANTEIYNCLNIQDIDPFYKKYIKYKLKYLNEKK